MSILKGQSINGKLHNREIELRQEGIKEGKQGNKRRKTRRNKRRKTRRNKRRKNKYEKHNKNS